MNTYKIQNIKMLLAGLVLVFAGARAGLAQTLDLPAATTKPITTQPLQKDDLSQILETDRAELEKLMRESVLNRLMSERQQVVLEIRDDVLFEEDQKDAAVKIIETNPANTQKDNIERICKAFAQLDEGFAGAYKLYTAGKYPEAAEAFKKIANAKEVRYFSAAKSYLLGDSLYKAGVAKLDAPKPTTNPADAAREDKVARKLVWDAYDAYRDLLENMPDRVSFSASAALNSALACDKLGRGFYALEMYVFCIKNFSLTLDKDQVAVILEKAKNLQEIYADPMASVTKMMGDVKTRLDAIDSGKETQEKQGKIVALLDDLIKTTEEKPQPPPNPDPKKSKKKDPSKGEGEGEGQSEGQSQGKGKGKGKGKAAGNDPSSPAQQSSLPDGAGRTLAPPSEIRDGGDKGDWAELSPREREKIKATKEAVMSERYRGMISDYFERLSSEKPK